MGSSLLKWFNQKLVKFANPVTWMFIKNTSYVMPDTTNNDAGKSETTSMGT